MSNTSQQDDITKPHFVRVNDEPQQIVKKENIAPVKYARGKKWRSTIPVIVVRDHPGEKTTAPTSSRGSEQEAMKKPATEILSQH